MPSRLSPLLSVYDHVLLDLDGTVWVGDEPIAGALGAVRALRLANKNIAFITNDARHSGEEFVRKLWALGFQASLEEIVTVGGALQRELAERYSQGTSAFVIGAPALWKHVTDAGLRIANRSEFASRAQVVVVGAHEDFDYDELRNALRAVLRGADILGAGRDRSFPMVDGAWPGTGAILAALEYAGSRVAQTVGKPEPALFETALDRLGPGRALMIGDRVDSDLAGAAAAGIDGALVLTGASVRGDAEQASPPPVAIADSLGSLVFDESAPAGS